MMIEIQRMSLNETKEVNPIGHVGGPSKIKEEHPNTFKKQYIIPKYEPRETKIRKRTDNKLEKIKEKMNKLENIMISIEIQQNTLISIGKDSKYIKGTTEKIV